MEVPVGTSATPGRCRIANRRPSCFVQVVILKALVGPGEMEGFEIAKQKWRVEKKETPAP